jgi:hypothetical protein
MSIISLSFNIAQYIYNSEYGDPTGHSLIYCKLRSYLANAWGQMSRYFCVYACIDRYTLTSANPRVRAISRPSVALWSLSISAVLWHIIPIHIMIFYSIINGRCGAYGPYFIFSSIYNLLVIWVIPCITMAIFGYMAYSNIKQLHRRIRPMQNDRGNNQENMVIHRRDRDLFIMVLTEVIAYIILMIPYPCITTEIAVTNYLIPQKSLQRQQIENFVMFLSQFLLNVTNAMTFYIYFLASKAFRHDCKKLLNKFRRCMTNRTDAMPETTMQTLTYGRTNAW